MTLLLACVLALAAEKGEPVAMVLRASEGATVHHGKQDARPLRDMDLLREGDILTAAREPVTLVYLSDGHGERVKAGKKVTVGAKAASPEDAIEKVDRKLTAATMKNLRGLVQSRGGVVVLRRGKERDGAPGVVAPIHGSTILGGKPEFAWPALDDAVKYTVRLYDARDDSEDGRKPVWKKAYSTKRPALDYPADEDPIAAGQIRYWEVEAELRGGGKRTIVRNCQVVIAGKSIQTDLAEFATLASSKDVNDWLLAANLYEARECDDVALALYKKADRARPDQPNILAGLWRLHTLAGNVSEAKTLEGRLTKLGFVFDKK